jgi:predicted GNAT superfamily acetyltransferase
VGTLAGVRLAEKAALLMPQSRLAVKLMPVAAIGGGMVAAYFADNHLGVQVEGHIRQAPAHFSHLAGNEPEYAVAGLDTGSHLRH